MQHLRIIFCTAILLSTAGFASAQQDQLTNIAGTGTSNPFVTSTAQPAGVAADSSGNVYIVDTTDCVVYELSSGTLNAIAGTAGTCGYGGDGAAANLALLQAPTRVALDSAGNLYIADTGNCIIREVAAPVTSGNITTIAGTVPTTSANCGFSGDAGSATNALLSSPSGVAVDASGDVFIADTNNNVIREVSGGNINTVVGDTSGTAGYVDESSGTPLSAEFSSPQGISLDSAGDLYIADEANNVIREYAISGNVSTVAGNGTAGFGGDGTAATSAKLNSPEDVAVDGAGDLNIADSSNNRIRWVDTAGIIRTIAGNGTLGASTPGLATSSDLGLPVGVGVDSTGNIVFADDNNYQADKVTAVSELGASPSSLTFATQGIGTTSSSQSVVLTATGYNLNISSIVAAPSQFSQSGCPTGILLSGTSCTILATFKPTQSGLVPGTLTITDNSFLGHSLVVNLSGTGGSAVTLTPNPLTFGPQSILSTSTPQSVVFSNIGSVALTGVTPTVTGDFSISSNDCGTAANGFKVNANTACSFLIEFKPTAVGTRTGTLSVSSSDAFSPSSISLQGTGTGTTLSPNRLVFPTKIVGISVAELLTVTNPTGHVLSSITYAFSGSNASDFAVESTGTTCTGTLNPGKTCKYHIVFTPVVNGAETATFTVTDSFGTEPMTASLTGSGTGTGTATIAPATTTFPITVDGVTSGVTRILTITSHTHISLGLAASIIGTNASDFQILGSGSCSGTLGPEPSKCTYQVSFTPSIVGAETAAFQVVVSDGSGTVSTLTSTLKGTGKAGSGGGD